MITVVGGVYRERCMRPSWQETYGSAGRAATAIARIGGDVSLHSYLDREALYVMRDRAALEGFQLDAVEVPQGVAFDYVHGLSTPDIRRPAESYEPLHISKERVLRFGMIEGDAVVDCEYAVYDPQSAVDPEPFHANGSRAKHLALVLNRYEASCMSRASGETPEAMARQLANEAGAEVVVIKMGPLGALVYDNGSVSTVPAYRTKHVWKIGSGDTFAAHFAYAWMQERRSPRDAADIASRATAFYCESQGHPSRKQLDQFSPEPLCASERYRDGYQPQVYLAGPFFSLAQLWLVREARNDLRGMGLRVFSPYHDVGRGSADDVVEKDLQGIRDCDLLFAIGDGLDAGTIYEIGYARALEKPVVMYSENESEEDKKMMEGSACRITDDYVSAVYQTVWAAAEL
ncbi:PfkB family carbohydrate kinase (plasmid) [Pseudomonas sp. BYT-5]|uniref:PfkB family carbohydrate kinase n=1 Tax=unclassified Pseudomonas TaxID=196821 RepID=UPI00202176FE|nr:MULTISPECIES: PfkB family carbohydrate kinase [unclassified Pseudomonas]URD45480.1 PfkB family carbohydrate kinase [Pseudomonas sp. BYT-5]URL00695.1 nucleoside 2-deoxyribosyltransferase [Pseudomonas sp. BYT-1]